MFQQHFVRTGIIPADIAKVLPRSFERRQDIDDFATLDQAEVAALREAVDRLLNACSEVLEQLKRTTS